MFRLLDDGALRGLAKGTAFSGSRNLSRAGGAGAISLKVNPFFDVSAPTPASPFPSSRERHALRMETCSRAVGVRFAVGQG